MDKCETIHRAVAGLAVLGLAAGSAGVVAAGGAVTSWSSTRDLQVTDPQYQMTAFTVPIPSGWKSAAQLIDGTGCHGTGPGLSSTAQSPDGSTTIEHLPGMRWTWTSSALAREQMANTHCPAVDIDSASSFLLNIAVPNLRPGAAITAILPLDADGQASLTKQREARRQGLEQAFGRYHMATPKFTIDGARVQIRYSDHGKLMQEQIQTIIDCNEMQSAAMYKLPASTTRNCTARNFYIVRAPQGHLDELLNSPAVLKLNQGIQMNQQWFTQMSQDLQKKTQAALDHDHAQLQQFLGDAARNNEAALARGRQFQQMEQTQFEHSQALDRANQNAIDQAAHGTELVSLGRKDFINPDTGQTIEANAYYDHQWLSSDGSTLIQTDNPNLNPNGVVYPVSQSWTELQPK